MSSAICLDLDQVCITGCRKRYHSILFSQSLWTPKFLDSIINLPKIYFLFLISDSGEKCLSLHFQTQNYKGTVFQQRFTFPKHQILGSSKLKEVADDNFKFNENGRKFSKWVENTAGKGLCSRHVKTRACLEKG